MRSPTVFICLSTLVIVLLIVAPESGSAGRRKMMKLKGLAALALLMKPKKKMIPIPIPIPIPFSSEKLMMKKRNSMIFHEQAVAVSAPPAMQVQHHASYMMPQIVAQPHVHPVICSMS